MKTIFTLFVFLFSITMFYPASSQTIAISGYVFDKNTGAIVKNASVFETAECIGTISNKNGFYKLLLEPGEKSVKISDAHYKTYIKKFDLKNDTTLTIQLQPLEKGNNNDSKYPADNGKKRNKRISTLLF